MVSEILLFIFALLVTAFLLFVLIYFLITLSDLECDYLNAQECCAKLNFVRNVKKWIRCLCNLINITFAVERTETVGPTISSSPSTSHGTLGAFPGECAHLRISCQEILQSEARQHRRVRPGRHPQSWRSEGSPHRGWSSYRMAVSMLLLLPLQVKYLNSLQLD